MRTVNVSFFLHARLKLSPTENFREFMFMALYMSSMMYQILIPCYFGSIVVRKSDELLGKMYASNWIEQSKRFKASLLIFGERAQKPIVPVAAGLFDVSLPTYVSVRFILNIVAFTTQEDINRYVCIYDLKCRS